MSQISKINSGGGGGGNVETLTPDVGGAVSPVAGNINVFGYPAGSTDTLTTYNDMGVFRIEDRAWATQYVVDPSTTPGIQGTYSSIQDAIDQANSDGSTFSNQAIILVRRQTYTENISIPDGMYVTICTIGVGGYQGGIFAPAIINGNLTFGAGSYCTLLNLLFTSNSGDTIEVGEASNVNIVNCIVAANGLGDNSLIIDGVGSQVTAQNSTFSNGINISAGSTPPHIFENCQMQSGTTISASEVVIENCTYNNTLTTSGTADIRMFDCGFDTNGSNQQIIHNSSNPITIVDSFIPSFGSTGLTGSGQFRIAGNTVNLGDPFYTPSLYSQLSQMPSQSGNLIKSRVTNATGNISNGDFYIGVSGTSAPITLTFPAVNTLTPDQTWIIKDQGGNAATNTITIATTTGTIDGAATFVMNVNYGSVSIKTDGTNFFIF